MGKPPKRDLILAGSKGEGERPISIQYINRILKKWIVKYELDINNFSTHSFRKTFGRYVYDKGGRDEKTLMYLNRIFKHASLDTTMIYLGIRDEEISNIFDSIQI